MTETVAINKEYITLGQLLKYENIVESGGHVKIFLNDYSVYINGDQDQRRGRKLYPGDIVDIEEVGRYEIIVET